MPDTGLAIYGLRPDQENFLETYIETGDFDEAVAMSGRTKATCRRWLRDPYISQIVQREAQFQLHNAAMGALSELKTLSREASDEKTRLQASKDLLDRAGYKPEHMHVSADRKMETASSNEMMERIRELQRELGMDASPVVEQAKQPQQPEDKTIDSIDTDPNDLKDPWEYGTDPENLM